MKKILIIILIFSVSSVYSVSYAVSVNTSHCDTSTNNNLCIKKAYLKKIAIQKSLLKDTLKSSTKFIEIIDTFVEKYKDQQEKLQRLEDRVITFSEKLSNSKKDMQMRVILDYILYKTRYSIEEINSIKSNTSGSINTQVPYHLSEAEFGIYLNKLSLIELGDVANRIDVMDEKMKNEVEDFKKSMLKSYSNMSTFDVNILKDSDKKEYFNMLIFFKYLEENQDIKKDYESEVDYSLIISSLKALESAIETNKYYPDFTLKNITIENKTHNIIYNGKQYTVYQGTIHNENFKKGRITVKDIEDFKFKIAYIELENEGKEEYIYQIGLDYNDGIELRGSYKKILDDDSNSLFKID